MKQNVLITGITGYIGSHLAKAIHNDYNLFGVVRQTSDTTQIKDYCQLVLVDDIEACFKSNKIDMVVHLATDYGRGQSSIPLNIVNSNLIFGVKLATLCKCYSIKRFVNADTCLERDTNYYSLSKKQFIEWLKILELPVTNIVLQHFYGPKNKNGDFISTMIMRLRSNNKIALTVGTQQRDFIYITDVISAIQCLLRHTYDANYCSIDIGSGITYTIRDVMLRLQKLLRTNIQLQFGSVPMRKNDDKLYIADTRYLQSLGWYSRISLDEGLTMCV